MKTSPLFAARRNDGELFWFDLSWGNTWSEGCGYVGMIAWGEEYRRTGYCRDNRMMVDPYDCEVELLGWTLEAEVGPGVELVVVGAEEL